MAAAGEAVRALILSFFLAHGYQPFQAEALSRNAWIETRWQFCQISKSGRWLMQWAGQRRHDLAAYAGTTGCPPLQMQLEFADIELKTIPAFACFWDAVDERSALAALRRGFEHGHC